MSYYKLYVLAALELAAMIALVAVWLVTVHDTVSAETAPAAPPALTVMLTSTTREHWPETLPAVGSILAWQEVVIGAEISGLRLARLLVVPGDRVRRGQLLAEIGKGTLEADLSANRAAMHEAEVIATDARRAAERALTLQQRETVTVQALEQAVAAAEMAAARLEAARARAEADALRLGFTEIRAPDDGVVSAVTAIEGAIVHTGQEILRLQRQGRLEWQAEMPGPDLVRLAPGQDVRIFLGGSEVVEGRLRLVSPQIDPSTRSGLVHVDLEPSASLRSGLFARGEILLDTFEVQTLPETAVLLRDGFSYVFVVEDGKARQQRVTVGMRSGNRVEISSGLEVGARVVESGVGFLSDGVAVRVAATVPDTPVLAFE